MEQLYYHCQESKGFQQILQPNGTNDLMGFALLKLTPGEEFTSRSGEYELAAVIMSGKASFVVENKHFENLGVRESVFQGKATTVYIPRDSDYRVKAETALEASFCQVKAEKKYQPFVVLPDEVTTNHRGAQFWQREVHDIIVENGEGRVDRIVVGETYSAPGSWSSFPSHKHDRNRPPQETELVEIYHFRVEPANLFGVQLLYTEDGKVNEAFLIRDRDTFKIPYGYHPVAAPPGVKLYYLWFLAGNHGREIIPYDDPAFRDLRKLETA
ncbi:5-deoxy-glucuronate isomerase [Moorella naiadis]|uniref:5-deoxy-glucuronate isomerase n=1 Tax=Moorella naiadis (nom. illeg.) TaxID=3093670 RepID=UPI003D9CA03B